MKRAKDTKASNDTGKIPWAVAQEIAERFGVDQVIVWAWEREAQQHMASYGNSAVDSDQAAQGKHTIAKFLLGWPEKVIQYPDRVIKLRKALEVYAGTENGDCAQRVLEEVFPE